MKFWRRVRAFLVRSEVAKDPDLILPAEVKQLLEDSKAIRRDLHELRRFEIIVRRR